MNKTLSTNVSPEQYEIIKEMAEENNMTVSAFLKESVKISIMLYYLNDVLEKVKFEEMTNEVILRNAEILEHANEMTKLMEPYYEKLFSSIPKKVVKALEEEGMELAETIETYEKPVRRGRPPAVLKSKE